MTAWSAPKSWVTSEIVPASDLNVYVRDNTNHLKEQVVNPGPIGELTLYAAAVNESGEQVIDSVWLVANGTNVSRTTYADLFAKLSTDYGAGDGTTTFGLPNMVGRMPVAQKTTDFPTRGGTGGEKTHVLTLAEMAAHDHGGSSGSAAPTTDSQGSHSHTGSSGSAGAHTHTLTAFTDTHSHNPVATYEGVFNQDLTGVKNIAAGTDIHGAALSPGTGAINQAHDHGGATGSGGSHSHSVTVDSGGDHSHSVTVGAGGGHSHTVTSHSHTIASAGSGTAHENMPPYLVLGGWLIRFAKV